ncbi:tryptophan--tRNA ligase [Candidatus Gracilibacteria bacterium]|nr:tryptophan--tRNA ligase [Candidatus Gracilibacteria bacterium]
MKKIITGVKSTGSSMHLGNLMGAVLPFGRTAVGNDAAIFIADLHSLTSVKDGKTLREQTLEVAIEYLAIYGVDTPITIFRQSDIRGITELMWILTNVTPYSLMNRAHSFKDFQQKREQAIADLNYLKGKHDAFSESNFLTKEVLESIDKSIHERTIIIQKLAEDFSENLNMGVFNYPILMAADIIGYDCEAVPVGKDQIQHLEMTRDIVRAFNKTYGQEVFREPEAIIDEAVAALPGIDGRKMSKSYDNFIGIFDDEKILKKRVMSIVSGSEGVDEKKKNPDECNIYNLYRVFATPEQTVALRVKYESENIGFGYGHAKTELLSVLTEYLRPYREAREKLLQNPAFVEAKLAEGAHIMNARLEEKMGVVKEVVGVN